MWCGLCQPEINFNFSNISLASTESIKMICTLENHSTTYQPKFIWTSALFAWIKSILSFVCRRTVLVKAARISVNELPIWATLPSSLLYYVYLHILCAGTCLWMLIKQLYCCTYRQGHAVTIQQQIDVDCRRRRIKSRAGSPQQRSDWLLLWSSSSLRSQPA